MEILYFYKNKNKFPKNFKNNSKKYILNKKQYKEI